MSPNLRAMLLFVGAIITVGATYILAVRNPDVPLVDVLDAGLLDVSTPARLECRFYTHPECRDLPLPDGPPLPAYMTAQVPARLIDAGSEGSVIVLYNFPSRADGGFCIIPVGTVAEACTVLELGSCSLPSVCSYAYPSPGLEQGACSRPDAGRCRLVETDGGLLNAPIGVTLAPFTWTGLGCFRKYPGPVVFAEGDESWPEECPQ